MRRGSDRATISDIATELGLSASTVSRALAGIATISDGTRLRVREAAGRLDYHGTPSARIASRRRPATHVIGVVVAALHNSFHTQLLDRLHDEFAAFGYRMALVMDSLADTGESAAFEALVEQHLDGVLVTTAATDSTFVQKLQRSRVPIVLAVRSIDGAVVDLVEVDNIRAGEAAARHLFDLGHRRIGFVMGPRNTSTARDRHAGAMGHLHAMGLDGQALPQVWGEFTHASGYSGAVQMLNRPARPTAIIAGNDTVAIGVLEAARKIGVAVPRQLSVIGFDDIPMAGWSLIGLTTIRQPTEDMARMAARRLIDRIRHPNGGAVFRDVLPADLVQRDTTAAPD